MSNVLDLSKCEKEIMAIFYDSKKELNVDETREKVNGAYNHQWTAQTVHTFLTRLTGKGWLTKTKVSGRCCYGVKHPQEEYEEFLLAEVLAIGFKGNPRRFEAAVARVVTQEGE